MKYDPEDPRITAYLFDELGPEERTEFETLLQQSPELEQLVRQTRVTIDSLKAEFDGGELLQLNDKQRSAVEAEFSAGSVDSKVTPVDKQRAASLRAISRRSRWVPLAGVCVVAAILIGSAWMLMPPDSYMAQYLAPHETNMSSKSATDSSLTANKTQRSVATAQPTQREKAMLEVQEVIEDVAIPFPANPPIIFPDKSEWDRLTQERSRMRLADKKNTNGSSVQADFDGLTDLIKTTVDVQSWGKTSDQLQSSEQVPQSFVTFDADNAIGNTALGLDPVGQPTQELNLGFIQAAPRDRIEASEQATVTGASDHLSTILSEPESPTTNGLPAALGNKVHFYYDLSDKADTKKSPLLRHRISEGLADADRRKSLGQLGRGFDESPDHGIGAGRGGDKYEPIVENEFLRVGDAPLSTFSIDVDTASYSKVRMFLSEHGQLPRPDSVRIEELLNYFTYDYQAPSGDDPFAAHQAVVACPWNAEHRLVRIALKGKEIAQDKRPASNLVFLLDVSGSMDQPNKLPLLKRGMKMLADQLSENDRVAIVVYAGAAGMVLDSTTGDKKSTIANSLERLKAGGSTNGGAGIELAYQIALDHFIQGGTNRVILCTDGDFNVGTTGTDELVKTIEQHAKTGVFLSVLGFGMGNHNDSMLEQISNKGNGNYAFIDNDNEARKVLVEQMSATLVTIAKDVKIQVEFNPKKVAAYRLIGYENRVMAAQDFNDDKKDAGEIGAGHTVTALYEIVPVGKKVETAPAVDELKYQTQVQPTAAADSDELLTLKLRYKQPDGDKSKLLSFPLVDSQQTFNEADRDFQFAASVASFGMLLRHSKYKGNASYASVLEIATAAAEKDESGYRQEFLELVRKAASLAGEPISR